MAMHVAQDVCEPVPHRQLVFTIAKRFRLFFRYDPVPARRPRPCRVGDRPGRPPGRPRP
jgi:hypothetical protein